MAVLPSDLSSQFALDVKGVDALRQQSKTNAKGALQGAATQFEAMFINMMMKSMREATPGEGMLDNQQTKMFTSMMDQQMSQKLATRGVGLANVLVRQLTQQQSNQILRIGDDSAQMPATKALTTFKQSAITPALESAPAAPSAASKSPHVRAFQDKLGASAEAAARESGIPAKFMLGQAALETGWGKHEIKNTDGSSSHNLFGIKAGPGWKGKVVTAATTEYVNGRPQTRLEKFRAYDSYADSFKDYAKTISTNPRYEKVLASANASDAGSFAHGLQKAGYATDPFYAAKLNRIIKHSLTG